MHQRLYNVNGNPHSVDFVNGIESSKMYPEIGDIVSIETGWKKTFAFWPRRTAKGQLIWFRTLYKRRIWCYNGFTDEPDTQYATFFDILRMT
jgi:hypothetical protein